MRKLIYKSLEPAILVGPKSLLVIVESFWSALWYEIVPLLSIPYLTKLVESGDKQGTLNFIGIMSLAYLFLWLVHFKIRNFDFHTRQLMEIAMNEKYRRQILLKDNLAMEQLGTGKLQSIVQKGFTAWSDNIWYLLYMIVRVMVGVGMGIYLTISMGINYFLIFIFLALLSGVAYTFFKIKQVNYDKKINEVDDELYDNYVRLIMSRQEVLFANNISFEIKKIKDYVGKKILLLPYFSKLDFIADLCISSLTILLPLVGGLYVVMFDANLETGLYLSLIYFSARFTSIMYWYTWMVGQMLDKYPQLKKFWDFLDNTAEIPNYDTGKKFIHSGGEIKLLDVNFSYENNLVLKNLNLNIKAGEKIALVGKSGSGKTTIAKIIAGYISPQKGKVFIDSQHLKGISLVSYYRYIGYLTQEAMVFDGSIKDNMIYALQEDRKNVSDEEIKACLLKAGCDFVFKLKKGINSQIGERGVRLSGGERQRLAIAKLFLKNPEIVILDEPTSALDSFSEEKITQALDELFLGRTTIIIAHRLQTVKKADRIIVLEAGKIVEEGKHDDLVECGGRYAQMLAMQSGI